MKSRHRHQRGSLLVEIIVVTFLFAIIGTGLLSTVVTSTTSSKQAAENIVAAGYIKEGIEAVRSIRDQDWALITNGSHGLTTTSGYYELSGTSDSLDSGIYTRTITIEDVYRTGSLTGDIAASGVLDANTKKVTVNITWDTLDDNTQNIDAVYYVTNWEAQQSWVQTLTADFTAGVGNSIDITTTSNGEVQLMGHELDWDGVQVLHELDLPSDDIRIVTHYEPTQDKVFTLGDDEEGLVKIDVSNIDTTAPTVQGTYNIDSPKDFVVQGEYAYVAVDDEDNEVYIIDTTDMSLLTTIDLEEDKIPYGIAITGDTLIIVREEGGDSEEVYYYDVSDPSSPSELGSTEVGESLYGVVTNGTYAFAYSHDSSEEVYAFRLSDYSEVDTLNLSGSHEVRDMAVNADNLYIARESGSGNDAHLVDVSDPVGSGMSVTTGYAAGSDVNGIAFDADEQYVVLATSENSEEVRILNATTFSEEQALNTSGSDDLFSIATFGGYIYAGSEDDDIDLTVLNVSTDPWGTPNVLSTVNKSGSHNAQEVVVVGTNAYLATSNAGSHDELFVYDVSSPATPVLLGDFNVGATVYGMVISGNYAYLATSSNSREIDIIDISTPSSMSRAGSYNASTGKNMYAIAISGTTLFSGRDAHRSVNEFVVYDVSTPASPVAVGGHNFASDINDLVVSGNYIYAATDSNSEEFVVYDVSTPSAPSKVATLNLLNSENAETIDIYGSTVVVGRNGGSDLAIIDVSTPTSPTILSQTSVSGGVYGVSMDGTDVVFLATTGTGAQAQRWNISNPSSPSISMSYDLGNTAGGVFFNGTNAFYATSANSAELQILGEGSSTSDYVLEGTLTSQAFDSGSSSTSWGAISWTESGTGDIEFRIRTADSEANLETATWVGSDGTSSTSYSTSETAISTDSGASGTQWIQWKAYFTGSGSATPVLEDVTITY